MEKVNYLNIGCGTKFHQAWTNVDMVSTDSAVQAHNVLKGLPFQDTQFDAVYHSQVLEHIPQEHAADFLSECLRVLKPGGILRVVVPDLENIASEYLRLLKDNLENPTPESLANYEWMMLEMYDQTLRHYSGGRMGDVLRAEKLINEDFVVSRIGIVQRTMNRPTHPTQSLGHESELAPKRRKITLQKVVDYGVWRLRYEWSRVISRCKKFKHSLRSEATRIGQFRLGGELHMWMYDRLSLARALRQAGFENMRQLDPYTSAIADWSVYELDVKNGNVYDPTSLFLEAVKPSKSANLTSAYAESRIMD